MAAGRVVIEEIRSEVLADNPLGDSPVRRVPVYLPPSYDRQPARRFPVVYYLVGFLGRGLSLLNVQPFQPTLPERLDALLNRGECGELILVMPDGFTRYGGSQYLNSPAVGRYEDHIVHELVPHIDRTFRTTGERAGRGVMGHSSGGFGAITYGMRHADTFAAVACHSGDMYFEYSYQPDLPKLFNALRPIGDARAFFAQLDGKPKFGRTDFDALNMLAMSACYSPNPRADPPFDLPIDLATGALRDDVWRRWLAHDPVNLVERYASALKSLALLYLDCGLRDEYNLHIGARVLSARLTAHGVAHEHHEFDDGHGGVAYRTDISLPKLSAALGAPAGLDV